MTLGAGLVNTCWLHVLLRVAGVPGSACDHQLRAESLFHVHSACPLISLVCGTILWFLV